MPKIDYQRYKNSRVLKYNYKKVHGKTAARFMILVLQQPTATKQTKLFAGREQEKSFLLLSFFT